MRGMTLGVGVLAGLWAVVCVVGVGSAGHGSGFEADGLTRAVSHGALWVLPPAYEFAVSDSGQLSVEIGVTGAYSEFRSDSENLFSPRAGVFLYPRGGLRGLALYAGIGEAGPEAGVWYVWRPREWSSRSHDGVCYRIGLGIARNTAPNWALSGHLGIGAALGFSF